MILNFMYQNKQLIKCFDCGNSSFKVKKIYNKEEIKTYKILYFNVECQKCDKEIELNINKISDIKVIV